VEELIDGEAVLNWERELPSNSEYKKIVSGLIEWISQEDEGEEEEEGEGGEKEKKDNHHEEEIDDIWEKEEN